MCTHEGNYLFKWKTVSSNGAIHSVCEQTIYGETLVEAVAQFVTMHDSIAPDEDGSAIEITSICWGE